MQATDLLHKPISSFVNLDDKNLDEVSAMHHEAYPVEMRIWSWELLSNDHIKERLMGRFSFLLYTDEYVGHCLALVDESFVQPESGKKALFIADMVVRPGLQGLGYGRLMAQEVLRRSTEENIRRIEFCAREATSYQAIEKSSHTEKILTESGYNKSEIGRQRFSESSPDSEFGRLIILQK